eukprot:5587116-Prymnesium_polylepis.1
MALQEERKRIAQRELERKMCLEWNRAERLQRKRMPSDEPVAAIGEQPAPMVEVSRDNTSQTEALPCPSEIQQLEAPAAGPPDYIGSVCMLLQQH